MKAGLGVINGGKSEVSDKNAPGSKAWMKAVRAHAKELSTSLETHYKDLARDLYEIYDTPIDGDRGNPPVYTAWGFKTFRDYAEQELDIHYKKAESLRGVYYWLEIELEGLDPAVRKRLEAMGWTKLRVMRRAVTVSNAKQFVERHEHSNYQTIEAAVKKIIDRKEDAAIEVEVRKKGDPIAKSNKLAAEKTAEELEEEAEEEAIPPAKKEYDWEHPDYFTSKSFAFLPDQLETVKQALKRASEISNSMSGGQNLALICLDYLATNDFTKASEEQRLRYVAKLEKLMGYKLIVVDPKTKDILFGLGTLEKVATAKE
jgi:hypothetical protein